MRTDFRPLENTSEPDQDSLIVDANHKPTIIPLESSEDFYESSSISNSPTFNVDIQPENTPINEGTVKNSSPDIEGSLPYFS